ncbi:MAG: hypothetical protein J6B00_03085 [Alphaproteobacteria bacterium]|nr:hypothetical protein [Alphaproteobacteria bacterium]
MKKVFFALILSFFVTKPAFCDSLEEYEKECLSFIKAPEVVVSSAYGKLRYRYDKDETFLRQETEKKFRDAGESMPKEFTPIGLTKVRDIFDFNLTVGQIEVSKGYVCLYPEKIDVRLEYYMPTIYILKGLAEGTCQYDLAVRHEKTHVQIYIEALDYFLPILKQETEELFGKIGVRVALPQNAQETAKALNEAYLKTIQKKVDAWHTEVETEQMKLDSLENYMMENLLCQKMDKAEAE